MYKKELNQAQTFFGIAAYHAASFLYLGAQNLKTFYEFQYNLNLGIRHFDDASLYGTTPIVDDFVVQTLGETSHNNIVAMLDYNSA